MKRLALIVVCCFVAAAALSAQTGSRPFFQPADTFSSKRFWTSASIGTAIYTGFSFGLWNAWYKDYEIGGFKTFNDLGEWNQVDKVGHTFTAYIESRYAFKGARWTGMDRRKAMWTGAGVGTLLQLTIEVMDGFSEKWGFSHSDVAFNTLGVGLFVSQEMLWQDQRIKMKVSSVPFDYPNATVTAINSKSTYTLKRRADELFGQSFGEKFLKDYNAQINWLSVNPRSFLPPGEDTRMPNWLNVAVGYGAAGMYGGFGNEWVDDDGSVYILDEVKYPRYRRFFLSLDVDLSRIQTRSHFWNTVLDMANWIKVPFPALEINTRGVFQFHPVFW